MSASPSPTPEPVANGLVQIVTADGGLFWSSGDVAANGQVLTTTEDGSQCKAFFRQIYTGEEVQVDGEDSGQKLFKLQHPAYDDLFVQANPLQWTTTEAHGTEFFSASVSGLLLYEAGAGNEQAFCGLSSLTVKPLALSDIGANCDQQSVFTLASQPLVYTYSNCVNGSSSWLSTGRIITLAVCIPIAVIFIIIGAFLLAKHGGPMSSGSGSRSRYAF